MAEAGAPFGFRIDPSDGKAYTFESFLSFYPNDGITRWNQALPVPGGENAIHMSPEEIKSSDAVRRAKTKTPSATVKPTQPTTALLPLVLGALRCDLGVTVITAPELKGMGEYVYVTKNGVTIKLAYDKQDTLLIDDVTSEPILCILLNSKDGGRVDLATTICNLGLKTGREGTDFKSQTLTETILKRHGYAKVNAQGHEVRRWDEAYAWCFKGMSHVVEIREERKEYKHLKRAKAGEQGQHAPAAKKAPAPKKAPAAKKTAPKKAPAKKTAKKTAAKKSAVERGVDGGGMASKPGAKELDIFSGDSEEEEKKAIEALLSETRSV